MKTTSVHKYGWVNWGGLKKFSKGRVLLTTYYLLLTTYYLLLYIYRVEFARVQLIQNVQVVFKLKAEVVACLLHCGEFTTGFI